MWPFKTHNHEQGLCNIYRLKHMEHDVGILSGDYNLCNSNGKKD